MFRKILALAMLVFLVAPSSFVRATTVQPPAQGFIISPPKDWIELPLPYQNVVVSYGRKGTLATFHITERDFEGSKTVDQLSWKDLFSPQFDSIAIHQESVTLLAGEKTKFCVYTLKPGEFKRTMEGKLPGKYMNYVLIHQSKLISITFKDTEDDFALTYPSFLAAIRTLRFNALTAPVFRKKT